MTPNNILKQSAIILIITIFLFSSKIPGQTFSATIQSCMNNDNKKIWTTT